MTSYEHRLVDVVNNPPSGETYDAIGREADAELASLRAELERVRAERDEWTACGKKVTSGLCGNAKETEGFVEEAVDILKGELAAANARIAELEASAAAMRQALERIRLAPTPNDRAKSACLIAAIDKVLGAALQSTAGTALLERMAVMERVCDSWVHGGTGREKDWGWADHKALAAYRAMKGESNGK